MAIKTATIPWKPFSKKHKLYIRDCLRDTTNIAEGSVRSGKTIDHCIVAATYLEQCKDKIHLASGSTVANAKLNIGDCNGFGLEHLFRGRCYWGKYKGNDALIIFTQTGQKVVVFAGGAKANSFQKILGNSYGLWIATEINQHHQSFIATAMARQFAAVDRKILWDLNPGNPNAWIYTDYIDPYCEQGTANYQHFTMKDNRAIPPERMAEVELLYPDKNSVHYRRDVLGQRCVAEGLCYRQYANSPADFYLQPGEHRDRMLQSIMLLTVGVDFGANGSAHAFVANGITRGFREVISVDEHYRKESITPKQLEDDFELFIVRLLAAFPWVRTITVRADSEATVLINGLKVRAAAKRLPVEILNAVKGAITDRISFYTSIQAQGRYFILPDKCKNLDSAFKNAVWDPKELTEDVRLDDGSSNIDSLDAVEYSTEPLMKDIQDVALIMSKQREGRRP